jgi:FMN phosphatase YigB (HAD superfamily)
MAAGLLNEGPDGDPLYAVAEETLRSATPTALLLSCDNVLYDATVWERWVVRLLRHVGVAIDQESFSRHWEGEYLSEIHCGRRDFDEAFRDFLHHLGLTRGLVDEVTGASQGRRHQCLRDARPLPQIRHTVLTLASRNIPLGLLADTELPVAELECQLTRFGFGGRFAFVLSSVELGHTKAEAPTYQAAADRFGKSVERIAFVGNCAAHLGTAARLGMATVAFNYDDDARADLYLRQFDELISLFSNWPLAS